MDKAICSVANAVLLSSLIPFFREPSFLSPCVSDGTVSYDAPPIPRDVCKTTLHLPFAAPQDIVISIGTGM